MILFCRTSLFCHCEDDIHFSDSHLHSDRNSVTVTMGIGLAEIWGIVAHPNTCKNHTKYIANSSTFLVFPKNMIMFT